MLFTILRPNTKNRWQYITGIRVKLICLTVYQPLIGYLILKSDSFVNV